MSDFKVGDKVKCVRADNLCGKLTKGKTYTITSIVPGITPTGGSSVCVDGIRDDWWYADRFELLPQPVESPDDWVTQDVVRARPGIDERAYRYDTTPEAGLQWDRAGAMKWDPMPMHGERGNGLTVHLRCRRRDYPQKPVEVHSVGPYVARSEYERVCLERDNLQEIVKAHEGILLDSIERHGKSVFVGTPNGWPLVPVDPSCIPEGHRAAEVTDQVNGKTTVIDFGRVHTWDTKSMYVQLVVEPIPTPAPLPRPEFPAWIRAGWWVAMDPGPGPVFWVYEDEPIVDEQCGEHTSIGKSVLLCGDQITPSMRSIPSNRWRKAKWQIN